jgi:hypothetical protein
VKNISTAFKDFRARSAKRLWTLPAWLGVAAAIISTITQALVGNWTAATAWLITCGWAAMYGCLATHVNRRLLPRLDLLDEIERNLR